MQDKINIFYTTCNGVKECKSLALNLLSNKKVVCINIINNVNSYYKEFGEIKTSNEKILIIKTFLSEIDLKKLLISYHPYDIPFLVRLITGDVNKEYQDWANKNL